MQRLIIAHITGGIGWAMLQAKFKRDRGISPHALRAPPSRESHFFRRRSDRFSRTRDWERVGYRLGLKMELRYDATTIITTYFQSCSWKNTSREISRGRTFSRYTFFNNCLFYIFIRINIK